MLRAALLQLNASDDPAANLPVTLSYVREAADAGARFILTPEVTNCVSSNRGRQREVLQHEEDDDTLAALSAEAKALKVWLLIGSLGLKTHDPDGRFANRSFLVSPRGDITARYDKIHMFDVDVSETETYRELEGYRPGTRAVVSQTDFATIGLTVCYDIRFPHLYRALAQKGARILTVPAAFSQPTGDGALGNASARPGHRKRLLRPCPRPDRDPSAIRRQDPQDPRPLHGHRPLGRGSGRCRHRSRRHAGRSRPFAGR